MMSSKKFRLIPDSLYKLLMDKDKESRSLNKKVNSTTNSKHLADDVKTLLVQDLIRQMHESEQRAESTPILVKNIQEKSIPVTQDTDFSTEFLSPRGLLIYNFLKSNGMRIDSSTKEVVLENVRLSASNAFEILKALTTKNVPTPAGFDQVKSFLLAKNAPKSLFTRGVQSKLFDDTRKKRNWTNY